ncbi:unnamed protein product [Heligmosomoides polygyrus]|uniref:SCP domain-containing protein n=1 Tax=Heligmosomoides polygyrus TaxID=6339 RepID=A0A183FUB7_HELPZ|nr:unnamed protein product [Heligmosomoides polygyrus]
MSPTVSMLLIITALLCVIATLNAEAEGVSFEKALEEECKDFHHFYSRQDWDDDLMELAETEAQQPGNLEEGAYLMKHTTTRTFKEGDKRSMRTKVRIALMGLVKHVQQIKVLTPGTKYGCGGVYNEKEKPRSMTVVCLYREGSNE